MKNRIGILSGVFDPIHKGHIGLALEAIKKANLDTVYFMTEAIPRRKQSPVHLAHRVAMLKLAIKPYSRLKLLEYPDKRFSVPKTLPRLSKNFNDDEMFFICGVDMLEHMPKWALVEEFLKKVNLVIAKRDPYSKVKINKLVKELPVAPKHICMIDSSSAELSSQKIREDLLKNSSSSDLLPSIRKYVKDNWLYTVPSSSISDS